MQLWREAQCLIVLETGKVICNDVLGPRYEVHFRGDGRCCEYTNIFPFSSLIIYSLNYFPDIFTIYLFKPYYLEVTDIFLHFSH